MPANSTRFKLIKAGRLIDARGDKPIENGAVLLEDSKILQVGHANEISPPDGAPVEEFDFPQGTVLPGLIDVHTHFNYMGDGSHTDDVMAMEDDIPAHPLYGQRPNPPGVGRYHRPRVWR